MAARVWKSYPQDEHRGSTNCRFSTAEGRAAGMRVQYMIYDTRRYQLMRYLSKRSQLEVTSGRNQEPEGRAGQCQLGMASEHWGKHRRQRQDRRGATTRGNDKARGWVRRAG